ncbi:MAG: hypothetical protein N3A69_16320, partial [Leptospiraceae bacterium]|nr:hypothetical protein [Leptospiraceae bacterium]
MFERENERNSSTGFQYPQSYEDDFTTNLDFDLYLEDVDSLSNALDISNFDVSNRLNESQDDLLDEIIDLDKLEDQSNLATSPSFPSIEEDAFERTDDLEIEPLTEDYLDEILQKPLPIQENESEEVPEETPDVDSP